MTMLSYVTREGELHSHGVISFSLHRIMVFHIVYAYEVARGQELNCIRLRRHKMVKRINFQSLQCKCYSIEH